MRPTRLAVVFFASGGALAVAAAAVNEVIWTWWLAFVVVFVALLFADTVFSPRLSSLALHLDIPARLQLMHEHEVTLVVARAGRIPFLLKVVVDVSDVLEPVPPLPPHSLTKGENMLRFVLKPLRRGMVEVESIWLAAKGPLGLVRVKRKVSMGVVRRVDPHLSVISRDAARLVSSKSLQAGARIERYRGDGTEFDQLREYVPGFDIRTIDWKASARNAKLLCRQYRAERNREVILAVDSGRLMSETIHDSPKLDHAIHSALVLAYISLRVGDRVGFASFDQRLNQYMVPVRGQGAFGAVSRVAARTDYSSHETNFTLSLMELARRHVRRALVVVLTDFVDTIAAELMLENLERLATKHLVVFVAFKDPALDEVARRDPKQMLDLHRSVVAQGLLQDRQVVIERLRRMGILCIDAAPGKVSARLIDKYLLAKRREAF